MKFSTILKVGKNFITATLTIMFIMPLSLVSAAPNVKNEADFDIPISELNKVKKKTPPKRMTSEAKKKKIIDAKSVESTSETAKTVEPAPPAAVPTVEPNKTNQDKTVDKKTPTADKPLTDSENIQIHHSPYSFVVAGKRTVIYAVIGSRADTKEINCTIREAEGAAPTSVKMVKVSGTQFTYTATLPGMSPERPSLRYTIIVVDSFGKETLSQEFMTPIASSPVVPGWQLESEGKAGSIEQKVSDKPL